MSQQITPQVDVGGLSLRGLGAFSSILATLSTDDVAPGAMLQMEKLGSYFPVNGPKAARVSDLLQRCNSVRIDRLSLAMGWRKGDSASLMSESAGGQAISLLCSCIFSLFNDEDSSTILSYLCHRLLPLGTACSSMSQLHRVGTILSSKLNALGFGTFLAEQVVRVCNVYEQLGVAVPSDLLESFSLDAAVDMFHALSRAVRETDLLVRIQGTSSMGYIIAIAMILFVEDCLITVQGVVINSGVRQSIIIELGSVTDQQGPSQILIEEILQKKPVLVLPIESSNKAMVKGRFQWSGHLADQFHLAFTDVGLPGCPNEVLVASCDLLYSLPCWTEDIFDSPLNDALPKGGLNVLLGTGPFDRLQKIWKEVFCVSPTLPRKNLKDAWSEFVSIVSNALSTVHCKCAKCSSEILLTGQRIIQSQRSCPKFGVWRSISRILNSALGVLFVNPGDNVSVYPGQFSMNILEKILRNFHNKNEPVYLSASRFIEPFVYELALVKGACVCYCTELATLQKSSDFRWSFELVDGMLVFNGRYFEFLKTSGHTRGRAKKSLIYKAKNIVPSNLGEHSSLTLTIREKLRTLELNAMIHSQARLARVDLHSILTASVSLRRSKSCEHSIDDALQPEYVSKVFITSVFEPRPVGKRKAIAQVRGNATAQLLCCEPGVICILQSDCCLTCALEEAGDEQAIVIAS